MQLVTLDRIAENNSSDFGNKALNLAKLHRYGFNVPTGIVIPSDVYRDFAKRILKNTAITPWYLLTNSESVTQAHIINEKIMLASVTVELVKELEAALTQLPLANSDMRYAVRSSSSMEDSVSLSFSGQFESYLNVKRIDLSRYIFKCWASLWSTRSINYCLINKINPDTLSMAVIVQEFINPDFAGVMFTADPVFQDSEQILIECVIGLGEGVVQGTVNPDRYHIIQTANDTFKVVLTKKGNQEYYIVPSEISGETLKTKLLVADQSMTISENALNELGRVAREIETKFSVPQDIEWIIRDEELFIVQVRPITGLKSVEESYRPGLINWTFLRINNANAGYISPHIRLNDKVNLRLVADRSSMNVSAGWLIEISGGYPNFEKLLDNEFLRCEQVSMVLINPKRLHGTIYRQFAPQSMITSTLAKFIDEVSAVYKDFTLIITEIYKPSMSGISRIIEGNLVTEVAFGSYIPKGIADTSLYVADQDGKIEKQLVAEQGEAVYIVEGKPKKILVNQRPILSIEQLKYLHQITNALEREYLNVLVEYGVKENASIYLIDFTQEGNSSEINVSDLRVISPGSVTGNILKVEAEDQLWKSLDAHFHSERLPDKQFGKESGMIILAEMPYLALEQFLRNNTYQNLGFIFRKGSLLGHLANILRELKVPAVICPEMFSEIGLEDVVSINTDQDELVIIHTALS